MFRHRISPRPVLPITSLCLLSSLSLAHTVVLFFIFMGTNAYRGGVGPHPHLRSPCLHCCLETPPSLALPQPWPGAMSACCWRGRTPSSPPPWVSTNAGTQGRSPWTALARYVYVLGTPTSQTWASPEPSASLGQPHHVTHPERTLLQPSISILSSPKGQAFLHALALLCPRSTPPPPEMVHTHPSNLEIGTILPWLCFLSLPGTDLLGSPYWVCPQALRP